MQNWIKISVPDTAENKRLDVFLSNECSVSRATVQQWVLAGYVRKNGVQVPKSTKLVANDELTLDTQALQEDTYEPQPENILLDIAYEDDYLLVVNKPKGMVVHPGAGNKEGTLVNALLYHTNGQLSHRAQQEERPGIVHRIDKDTSGLLVVAKDNETDAFLAQQFKEHSITRVYHAMAYGHFKQANGTVDTLIGRSSKDRTKMTVNVAQGRRAITHYHVERTFRDFSYLNLQLETGRTHQIRVHMAHLKHPLAGDVVYGPRKVIKSLHGQCLHAKTLGFIHPYTKQYVCFDSELPAYFSTFIKSLEGNELK